MTDAVSLATSLKKKLAANDQQRLDSLAEALLDSAINKNTTAMKLVVELVEPDRPREAETMSDEAVIAGLVRFAERIGAHLHRKEDLD